MIIEWFMRVSAVLFWLLLLVATYRVVRGEKWYGGGLNEKLRLGEHVSAVVKRPGRKRTIG